MENYLRILIKNVAERREWARRIDRRGAGWEGSDRPGGQLVRPSVARVMSAGKQSENKHLNGIWATAGAC